MNSYFNFPTTVSVANPCGSRELIMIVDDEDAVTLLAKGVLAQDGYRVITARNGFQALDIFRKMQEEIDLVILDFVMPIMGGAEVLSAMRKINPKAPVVLTSGFTSDESLKELLRKGLCGFIPKPLAQKKLLQSVRSTLDEIRKEGANAPAARCMA